MYQPTTSLPVNNTNNTTTQAAPSFTPTSSQLPFNAYDPNQQFKQQENKLELKRYPTTSNNDASKQEEDKEQKDLNDIKSEPIDDNDKKISGSNNASNESGSLISYLWPFGKGGNNAKKPAPKKAVLPSDKKKTVSIVT